MTLTMRKKVAVLLVLVLCISMFNNLGVLSAKKMKPKLLNRLSVNISKTKTLKIKGVSKSMIKKTIWNVSNKKKITLSKKRKNSVKVFGRRSGQAKITASVRVGKKTHKLKTTVKIVAPNAKPSATATARSTTAKPAATIKPTAAATTHPTQSPSTGSPVPTTDISIVKKVPVIVTEPTAQAVKYGSVLSSASLSGGVVKDGDTIVEGIFSWYSPSTIPTRGTNLYTVKFTPSNEFANRYHTALCHINVTPVDLTSTDYPAGQLPIGTLREAYAPVFGNMGVMVDPSDFTDTTLMTELKRQYNSITMQNSMKPDSVLATTSTGTGQNRITTVTTQSTLPDGYVANTTYPYKDSAFYLLNLTSLNEYIEAAYKEGLKLRFHTLLWHKQTPTAFFRKGFASNNGYVDADTMNGRLEYYIRNVINYIYNTPHGKDVVYAFDVVNEYTHNIDENKKPDWDQVYYPGYTFKSGSHSGIWNPSYVIDAFKFSHDQLTKLEAAGKIKSVNDIGLFYNDYNEYIEVDNILTLISNINKDKKVCTGVGMQMHLAVHYPSVAAGGMVSTMIDKFKEAGLEMQITELDVTYNFSYESNGFEDKGETLAQQTAYYDSLFKLLIDKKSKGANITGVTFWGQSDVNSWRGSGQPLVFATFARSAREGRWPTPARTTMVKPAYFNLLEAVNEYKVMG